MKRQRLGWRGKNKKRKGIRSELPQKEGKSRKKSTKRSEEGSKSA